MALYIYPLPHPRVCDAAHRDLNCNTRVFLQARPRSCHNWLMMTILLRIWKSRQEEWSSNRQGRVKNYTYGNNSTAVGCSFGVCYTYYLLLVVCCWYRKEGSIYYPEAHRCSLLIYLLPPRSLDALWTYSLAMCRYDMYNTTSWTDASPRLYVMMMMMLRGEKPYGLSRIDVLKQNWLEGQLSITPP